MDLSFDEFPEAPTHQLPTAISSLIAGAVATFDADRDASRRYLQRASALLQAQWDASHDPGSRRGPKFPAGLAAWQVNRVLDYIEVHLSRRITLCDLARPIQVSREKLCRGFKISVGVSPSRYIAMRRVERACVMLKTTHEPLSQVAISCGLYDQSHFCRIFRRVRGVSPAAWRRANSIDPGGFAPPPSVPTAVRLAAAPQINSPPVPEIRSFLFSPAKYCRRPPPAPAR
jgi:AraC family transcriptional regulator